jgi:ferrous-iron efflux pump FieF
MTENVLAAQDQQQKLTSGEKTIFAGLLLGMLSLIPRILAAILSGSVVLFTDVLRSGTETLSHYFSWLTLRKIRKGRNDAFEYGMGKLENMASLLIVGIMLLGAAVMSYASLQRILSPRPVEQLGLGILVVTASAVSNFILWRKSHGIAKSHQTPSPLMESHWRLTRNKFLANLSVIFSLLLVTLFRPYGFAVYIDPVASLLLCLFVVYSACGILTSSLSDLLDRTIDESLQLVVIRLLSDFYDDYIHFHGVRSRRAGKDIFIEIFLEFDGERKMAQVQETITRMVEKLESCVAGSHVMIVPSTRPPRFSSVESQVRREGLRDIDA